MPILNDEHCETKVKVRTKMYDEGPGAVKHFYVDVLPSGVATFCFKKPYVRIGVYRPADLSDAFTVKEARIAAREIQNRIDRGEDVSATAHRDQASFKERQGLTVDKLIEKRIEFIKTPEPKADGKMRPRLETWENVASHLRRLVSPRLGRKLVADVRRADIVKLANDIVVGKNVDSKPSKSNARHMCMAVSGLFNWAIECEFITHSPAIRLGKWTNNKTKNARKRILAAPEIKRFWTGLDNDNLPHDRRTRLALKFELVSMLRGCEFMPLRKDEVFNLDGHDPYLFIPLDRVKKRDHDLYVPLSSLAVEIIREAMKDNKTDYVFATVQRGGKLINKPLRTTATASALRDRTDKGEAPGLCSLLDLAKFTPHDLRRTAATVARSIGLPLSKVSMCLDHAVKREDGVVIPAVTRRHYVHAHAQELAEKREVLEKLADEIRHMIGDERSDFAMAA
jgi:integrase